MADKRMSIVFDASMNIAQVKSAVSEIQKAFAGVTMPQNIANGFTKTFESLNREIANFEQQAAKGMESAADFKALSKSGDKILTLYNNLQVSVRQLGSISDRELAKLFPPEVTKNIEQAHKALDGYNAAVAQSAKDIRTQNQLIQEQSNKLKDAQAGLDKWQNKNVMASSAISQLKKDMNAAIQEANNYKTAITQAQEEIDKRVAGFKNPNANPRSSSKVRQLMDEIDRLTTELGKAEDRARTLNEQLSNSTTLDKQSQNIQKYTQDIATAEAEINRLTQVLNQMNSAGDTTALNTLYNELSKIQGLDITQFPRTIDGMRQAIASLDANGLAQLRQGMQGLINSVEQGAPAMNDFANKNREAGAAMAEFNRQSREVDMLKHRIQYFFGLTNSIYLFRNAIKSALNTVKELDAAMTETAVVTDFSVGDMWDKLPLYTETANKLGTTTLGAYQTMTLFYQQGLKTNEVFEIGTETMKMARIAGMDYTEATNMMTAALRGFNMELNDTSAQRVNDVYSQLAAITASDVGEISTAMTKTASIAHNANMEFETTSAFLAQIIETTRESAETAGTAMKTVIARFQELKKDPAEISMVDGEAVDANKIETALKTIGVALRDVNGQFRDLDDVFLDIAAKWGSLDTNTQRYIATMAAGSRQQSRFIAMMSDYDRTMQLVTAANDSAGASERQFQKTVDSLESKLNKLSNAWDAFTMGLANSEVIKFVVDALTGLVNGINVATDSVGKMVDMLPGVSSEAGTAASGIAKFAVAFGALKAGRTIFNAIFKSMKKMDSSAGQMSKTFVNRFNAMGNKITDFGSRLENLTKKNFWVGTTPPPIDPKVNAGYVSLQTAITNVSNASKHQAEVEAMSTATAQMKYKATQGLTRAQAGYAAALANLGLTEESYNLIQAANLTQDEMEILMSDSLAAAKLRQKIVTEGLTAEEIKNAAAQALLQNKEKMGLLTRIANIALLAFGTAEMRAQAAAALGLAIKTETATVATTKFNAALMACPIGWIIIGIVALAAAVWALWKAYEAGTPEKQLENAQKAADAMADAVDKAKASLDDLKTGLDELGESYSNLDNLTRGTDEWKEAIVSTNDQVLELIKNFRELAPFVTNKDGVLRLDISSDEVQGVIADKQKDLLLAQSAKAMADINVEKKQNQLDYSQLNYEAKAKEVVYYKNYDANTATGTRITKEEYDKLKQTQTSDYNTSGQLQESITVSKDLTEALAKAIASGEVFNDDNDTSDLAYKDEIAAWLSNQSISDIDTSSIDSMSEALAQNVDYLHEFGSGLIASEAAQRTYQDSIINNAREYSNIGDSIQGGLVNQLDSDVFADTLNTHIADETSKIAEGQDSNGNLTTQDLKDYAALSNGAYEVKGNKIVDAETKEEVGISNEDIKQQLAAARATADLAVNMDQIATTFQNISHAKGIGKAEDLAALLSHDGESISREKLKEYAKVLTNPENVDWDQFAGDFGFENMEKMAQSFGMTVEDMAKMIGDNFAKANDELNKRRANTVGAVKKANKATDKSYDSIIKELQDLETKFGDIDFNGVFDGVNAALARSGNEDIVSAGLSEFWNAANDSNNSVAEIQQFSRTIESIDWSNPIEAVSSLNDELENGSALTKQFAQKMLQAGKTAYSAGNQMQYMLKSESFEDVQEDISEIIELNGQLSASDVLDLADGYKTLDKFMKNTKTTANGVAKALTAVSKGQITMNQLTDAVLAGISTFDGLDGIVAKVLKTLEDFDPGADENDVAEFVTTVYETINGNFEKGAVGNNQNFSYLDLLLGKGWRQKIDEDGNLIDLQGEELVTKMKQANEKLGQNQYDMHNSWADLAAGKDFYGEEAGSLGNLSIVNTGSDIKLTGFEGMTSEDIVAILADAYHVSETYAEMMLADFKNYSADLAYELRENDINAAIDKMYENASSVERIRWTTEGGSNGYTDAYIIDESEIQAMAEMTGRAYEDVKQQIADKGALITNFYDEEGFLRSNSQVVAEMKRVLLDDEADETAKWYAGFLKTIETDAKGNKVNILDYDKMQEIMNDLHIPPENFNEIGTAVINDINSQLAEGETVKVNYKLSDGSVEQLVITPDIDLDTAIRNAETKLQNRELAEAISAAFADAEVSVDLDTDSVQAAQQQVTETISGEDYVVKVTTDSANMTQVKNTITSTAESLKPSVNIQAKTKAIEDAVKKLNLKTTITVTPVVASTGHADGIKNASRTHTALVAEEGPELIQTKDGAYIAEKPQFAQINKGDTVYTAKETKDILSQGPQNQFPRFASGYNTKYGYKDKNGNNNGNNGNNDNDSDDDKDLWENPYDWLYNLTEKINENLRTRNILEKKFQVLQKRGRTNYKIVEDYYRKQFKLISQTYDLEKEMMEKRTGEMQRYLAENQDMAKYGTFNFEDMRIEINWDEIEKLDLTENTEEGERIEDYISELERIQEAIEDAEEAMLDAQLEYEDLKSSLRESYLTLEDRVIAALEQIDRNEVEALKQVYDAVTDADDDLLEAMRQQIDEYRQARDNKETEEDIAKKERRLAYMRQDTSGGNKLDILKLEDEIEKARQQYQDQLVDQALTNLQTQQDYAAEQRDKQIALMESQIDWNVKNGVYAAQAAAMLQQLTFDNNGLITTDSELYRVLYEGEQWKSKSPTAINQILEELSKLVNDTRTLLTLTEDGTIEGTTNVFDPQLDYMAQMQQEYAAAGGQMTDKIKQLNEQRNAKIRNDPELAAKYPELSDSQVAQELAAWWKNGGNKTQISGINRNPYIPGGTTNTGSKPSTPTQTTPPATQTPSTPTSFTPSVGSYVRVSSGAVFVNGQTMSSRVRTAGVIDGKPGGFKILKDGGNGNYYIGRSWTSTGVTGLINKKYLTAYAHGGLADFTGPAWLDGTPSKPEAVLNAQDTRNFFELRDILRDSLDGAASVVKNGDTFQFDVDVNNPTVTSDYDVDALVARVESDIYDKSMYRNVKSAGRLK